MRIREEKERQQLQEALELMGLTEKNRKLAEQYLDVDEPGGEELLLEVEHQDFTDFSWQTQKKLDDYLEALKKGQQTEQTGRYIRFVVEVAGSTARYALTHYSHKPELEFICQFLTPVQAIAVWAEAVVWKRQRLLRDELEPIFAMAGKDAELFLKAMELCYDEDAANTKMILSAMYLHSVRPLKEPESCLRVLPGEQDTRLEAPPERIRYAREYLEGRLIRNAGGLYDDSNSLGEEDVKRMEDFVRNPHVRALAPVFSGRKLSAYRTLFLPFCAFLSVEHSNRFVAMIRLAAAVTENMNDYGALDGCYQAGKLWFQRYSAALFEILPISPDTYVRWALQKKEEAVLRRMAGKEPEAVERVLKNVSLYDFGYLAECIREGNPQLYEKIAPRIAEDYRRLAAREQVQRYEPAADKAEQYLCGEAALEEILPYVKQWRERVIYDGKKYERMNSILKTGELGMYRRMIVLECLRLSDGYFWSNGVLGKADPEYGGGYCRMLARGQIGRILEILEEEQVSVQLQMEFFGSAYDGVYDEKRKKDGLDLCAGVIGEYKENWKQSYGEVARKALAPARLLTILIMDHLGEPFKEELLDCAAESAKQVRGLLETVYEGHREWEADILAMLDSRKGAVREMGALVLKRWGAEKYQDVLSRAAEVEKSKKIKDLLKSLLASGQNSGGEEEQSLEALAEELLKAGKRKTAWTQEYSLGEVHKKDGSLAGEPLLQAFLSAYACMDRLGISPAASRLSEELNTRELAAYMRLLFDRWLELGAEAKKKWVLYGAAIHGGEEIIPVLYRQIQEWPLKARGAMAAEAVRALALNPSSQALLLVDQISRKFKFRQVKNAAGEALAYAAKELGISREELEDRIVPNLGFDASMEQVYDYGPRSFRVRLTPELSLEISDDNGKKLKNLPAPGKRDHQEKAAEASDAFKQMKRQLKTVAANQKLRLSQALSTERLWTVERWQALFVENPIMHQFAMGLVWGLYEEVSHGADPGHGAGQTDAACATYMLKDTFRYMEDGSFNTVEEEEYEFPAEGKIGLVHPIELSPELLEGWKEQLADYEVTQPLEQLERPVYRITEEEKGRYELTRFGGRVLNGLSLSGKLLGQGWYRGPVEDGGGYYTFYREDGPIGVELEFSGTYIGGENDEVIVYGAWFYRTDQVKSGSFQYDKKREEHGYLLEEVHPRYFSETVLRLLEATASSQRQAPYPACRGKS